ncbi:MAG: DUF2914 domain-containing protein [Pseudomonadota bacterium]
MEWIKRLWPWISLAWGIFSGVSMSRDFSQSLKIAIFAVVVILASMLLALVRELNVLRSIVFHRFQGAKSLEWVSNASLQTWSQTVMMFSLPMLYLGDAWFVLGITTILAVLTLWDPWFHRFTSQSAGRALLRTWAGLLTVSFLSGFLFPGMIGQFYRYFWLVAGILSFPWLAAARKQWQLASFVPFGLSLILSVGSFLEITPFRFPLVCIWLEKAGFFERATFDGKNFIQNMGSDKPFFKDGVCFMSPVIAARKVKTDLIHEWYVNEKLVDRIPLRDIEGRDEKLSFHTWSCKQNLPDDIEVLRVKVLLPDGAILGERSISRF